MAKALLPNQHLLLHQYYPDNCCLCKAELRIWQLEESVKELEARLELLESGIELDTPIDHGIDDGYKERLRCPNT